MDIQSSNNKGKTKRKKHSENWHRLNQEAADSILKRLSFNDSYNFGLVCSSWRSLLSNAVTDKNYHPLTQTPLLLLCPSTRSSNKVPSFFEVGKDRILRFENNIYPRNRLVLGTVGSWLIMAEAKTRTTKSSFIPLGGVHDVDTINTNNYSLNLFFFNPMSKTNVMLPSIMNYNNDDSHIPKIIKMVASSSPYGYCSDDDEPIFVAGLTCCGIIFCKITDKSWKLVERGRTVTEIVMTKSLLYGLVGTTGHHTIEIYNLLALDKYDQRANKNPPIAEILMVLRPWPQIKSEVVYLAHDELFGDLVMVENDNTTGFRVSKLERRTRTKNNYTVGVCEWVEVKDLGDRLIFVDEKSCRLISTVDLDENNVLRRNCIYYALNKYHKAHRCWTIDSGMFHLSDKSFHYFRVAESVLQNCANSVWLMP